MLSENPTDRDLVLQHIHQQSQQRVNRKKKLYNQLRYRYHVQPREDSRLCRKYIYGENIPINYIAYMLKEQDYFYKHTDYPIINRDLQAHHKQFCPVATDPYYVKDLFSTISKDLCRNQIRLESAPKCSAIYCLLAGKKNQEDVYVDKGEKEEKNFVGEFDDARSQSSEHASIPKRPLDVCESIESDQSKQSSKIQKLDDTNDDTNHDIINVQ